VEGAEEIRVQILLSATSAVLHAILNDRPRLHKYHLPTLPYDFTSRQNLIGSATRSSTEASQSSQSSASRHRNSDVSYAGLQTSSTLKS
jgi:hypothetical protein